MKKSALVALAIGLAPTLAAAEDPAAGSYAAAEDLFQRAMALMKAGHDADACPLLVESQRIDPAGGTLQNLALCYERAGLCASAYARFEDLRGGAAKERPRRQDRIDLATQHQAALRPKLSRIHLDADSLKDAYRTVSLDGVEYGNVAWKGGILVDPGSHVVARAGADPFRTTVVVGTTSSDPVVHLPAPAYGRPGLRRAGLVVGAVGVAALGTGAVFGVATIAQNHAGKTACHGGTGADFDPASGTCYQGSAAWQDANDKKSQARTFGSLSTALVVPGAALLAGGIALYWLGTKPHQQEQVYFAPTFGGETIGGTI